jgi:hypothetical protein
MAAKGVSFTRDKSFGNANWRWERLCILDDAWGRRKPF